MRNVTFDNFCNLDSVLKELKLKIFVIKDSNSFSYIVALSAPAAISLYKDFYDEDIEQIERISPILLPFKTYEVYNRIYKLIFNISKLNPAEEIMVLYAGDMSLAYKYE
jgi:hypothetical protein